VRAGTGAEAERRARRHFRLRGYRIVAENVWAAGYELDLIVRRGRSLVVCEVKSKGGHGRGHPAEMVGAEKQRRLRLAAETWVGRRADLSGLDVSLEVVAVQDGRLQRLRLE
jgi:putative endonuclease